MNSMKEENDALLKRLKELEESGVRGQGGNQARSEDDELVPRKSWEVLNQRNEELQNELKQKDKRMLRLRQVSILKVCLGKTILSCQLYSGLPCEVR